jgi:hypothetical protein
VCLFVQADAAPYIYVCRSTGWSYKEITVEDLKFPMVYGEGKRSRLLATIGVTRGFGDHDLRAQSQNGPIYIKPFLSPQPGVRLLKLFYTVVILMLKIG